MTTIWEIDCRSSWRSSIRLLVEDKMDKRSVVLIPKFVAVGGDLVVGLLLSQIYWWETHGNKGKNKKFVERDGFRWVAKTCQQIQNETGLTKHRQLRASSVLKGLGLIETRVMKHNGIPMNHWRLNHERLACLLSLLNEDTQKVVNS